MYLDSRQYDRSDLCFSYWCQERGINMLFVLGGNGTHAGANAIHNEVVKPEAL
jgi:6-phosphofructokinase